MFEVSGAQVTLRSVNDLPVDKSSSLARQRHRFTPLLNFRVARQNEAARAADAAACIDLSVGAVLLKNEWGRR